MTQEQIGMLKERAKRMSKASHDKTKSGYDELAGIIDMLLQVIDFYEKKST